jgi:flagellar P-ring protein precursor FlgI
MRLLAIVCLAALALTQPLASAQTMTVQEIARLSTDSKFTLQGLGLVMGLPGTGDSGKELAMTRSLAAVLERNGSPVPLLKELEKTRSVALVMVTCDVPAGGARVNDSLDVTVATLGSASSLDGGQLFVAPLLGPVPGSPVYAMASGPIMLQNPAIPTTARVVGGAQIVQELAMPAPETRFDLVLEPHYRGYAAASQVATAINDSYFNSPAAQGLRVAYARDDRMISVEIPEGERAEPAAFIADVMSTQVSRSLLKLPAVVMCNVRTGAITFTGDVRISPVALTMDGVSITSTVPPPIPTPADPLVMQSRWIGLTTETNGTEGAKLDELLAAFEQLNIPSKDQIAIIQQIHKQGSLHAKLIVE